MKTLVVVSTVLYSDKVKVDKKASLLVSDELTITEENAVDLLIDSGFIERDEDFESTVDFYRDCESNLIDEHTYVFDLTETIVTMVIV